MQTSTAYKSYANVMQNSQSALSGTSQEQFSKEESLASLNMPDDVKEAFSAALDSLGGGNKLMALSLTLDLGRLNATLSNSEYKPTSMDYDYLKNRVDSLLNPTNGGYASPEAKESITAFWNAFDAAYTGERTQDMQSKDEENSAVEKFLHDLRTKGAAKFLADLNQEKIDKLIEEYTQKLMKEMGDSPEAMEKIAKLVDEFKKNLIEEMKEKMEEELKNAKNVNTIKIDTFIMTMLNNVQEKKPSPLKELLKA